MHRIHENPCSLNSQNEIEERSFKYFPEIINKYPKRFAPRPGELAQCRFARHICTHVPSVHFAKLQLKTTTSRIQIGYDGTDGAMQLNFETIVK